MTFRQSDTWWTCIISLKSFINQSKKKRHKDYKKINRLFSQHTRSKYRTKISSWHHACVSQIHIILRSFLGDSDVLCHYHLCCSVWNNTASRKNRLHPRDPILFLILSDRNRATILFSVHWLVRIDCLFVSTRTFTTMWSRSRITVACKQRSKFFSSQAPKPNEPVLARVRSYKGSRCTTLSRWNLSS